MAVPLCSIRILASSNSLRTAPPSSSPHAATAHTTATTPMSSRMGRASLRRLAQARIEYDRAMRVLALLALLGSGPGCGDDDGGGDASSSIDGTSGSDGQGPVSDGATLPDGPAGPDGAFPCSPSGSCETGPQCGSICC